jgi:hypothetical protein
MQMFDKLPQLIAGATFLVLTLAIVHEVAYFAVVGWQFQSLMSATDYLVSALSWMPLVLISFLVVAVLSLAFVRFTEGRSPTELRSSTDKRFRVLASVMDTFFGFTAAFAFAVSAILFGNLYQLYLAQGLVAIATVTFLFWLGKFQLFERALTFPIILLLSLLVGLFTISFVAGRGDGYRDLTTNRNIHAVTLKSSPESVNMSVLRLLNAGVLARKPEEQKILFIRWDQIEVLSLEFTKLDTRSLICRLVGWDCPTNRTAPTTPPMKTPTT